MKTKHVQADVEMPESFDKKNISITPVKHALWLEYICLSIYLLLILFSHMLNNY